MIDVPKALADCEFIGQMSEAGQAEAARICKVHSFSENQIIYHKGSSPKTMAMVASGSVRVNSVNAAGKEMTLVICGPGSWFGDAVFFAETPRPFGAVAHEPTILIEFPAEPFMKLLSSNPECYPSIIKHLAYRLQATFTVIEDDALRSLPARVAGRLLLVADFQLGEQVESVSLRLTQEQLGNMLAITRQAAHRSMQTLMNEGLIEFGYGYIHIKSRKGLKQFIASN